MIRLGCLINNSKIGFTSRISSIIPSAIGHHFLFQRKFCEKSLQQNSRINTIIDEIKGGLQKLELIAEKQKNTTLNETQINEIDNKFAQLMKEVKELSDVNHEKFVKIQHDFDALQKEKDDKHESILKQLEQINLTNLTERIQGLEIIAMKMSKWNLADRASNLTISEDGLEVKHSGLDDELKCVRAILPIPSFNILAKIQNPAIVCYYEVEILKKKAAEGGIGIGIGFCTKQYKLESRALGLANTDSIGIWRKDGILVDGPMSATKFNDGNEWFEEEDVVGVGILHFPNTNSLQCFSTWNGKILGNAEMPPKFANFQLFPVANLFDSENSIRVNFDKDKWRLKQFEFVLET